MTLENFVFVLIYLNSEIFTLLLILSLIFMYSFMHFFDKLYQKNEKKNNSLYFWLLIIGFSFYLYNFIMLPITWSPVYFFDNHFIYVHLICIIKWVMIGLLIFYFIFLYQWADTFEAYGYSIFEYIILILISFLALQFILISNNLFVIVLFLEIANLCVYCLLGMNNDLNAAIESTYKYFIQSAYATIFGLLGVSLIFISSGTLFINEINIYLNQNPFDLICIIGIFTILISIFFKLGMVPVHIWIAEIYQGSMLATLLFIATIPKLVYAFLFFNLFMNFWFFIQTFCLIISFITIIYGSLVALYQTNFKSLIGYGSMAHMGLVVFTISIGPDVGFAAAFFYLFFYIFLVFYLLSFIFYLHERDMDDAIILIEDVSRIGLIFYRNKVLAFMLVSILFSLAGLPFFIGFVAKWYIFLSLISNQMFIELLIFFFLSLVSASYYIRLVRFLFFMDNKNFKNLYFLGEYYININKYDWFFFFLALICLLNIFIIFFHFTIYAYLIKAIFYIFVLK